MVVVNVAKTKIATLIGNDLSTGSLGTSSQSPAVTDTALILEDTSTIEILDVTPNTNQLVIDYNIDSLTGNGNTYTEFANKFTDGTLLNRVVFTGIPKSSSITFNVKTIVNID